MIDQNQTYAAQVYAGMTPNGNGKHAYVVFNSNGNKIDVILSHSEYELRQKYPDTILLRHQFEVKGKEYTYLKGFIKRQKELQTT